jgi:PTH1 family peptidyl-tRNA hydrolase
MEKTTFIIGLGNPGKEYEGTRHNLGFTAIENVKLKMQNCSDWKLQKRANAMVAECLFTNTKVVLAKPQTFMNDSGRAVKSLTTTYKLKATSLFVVHDDLALSLGTIRIRMDGSSGGHKGVQSIIDSLHNEDFTRIRIGIGPSREIKDAKKFVLQKFSKKEQEVIQRAIEEVNNVITEMIEKGVEEKTVTVGQPHH